MVGIMPSTSPTKSCTRSEILANGAADAGMLASENEVRCRLRHNQSEVLVEALAQRLQGAYDVQQDGGASPAKANG